MTDLDELRAILDAHLEAEVGPEMAAKIRALAEANRAVLDAYGREFRARARQCAQELAPGIEAAALMTLEAEWT